MGPLAKCICASAWTKTAAPLFASVSTIPAAASRLNQAASSPSPAGSQSTPGMVSCSWTFPPSPIVTFSTVSTTGTAYFSPAPTAFQPRSGRSYEWRLGAPKALVPAQGGPLARPPRLRASQQLPLPSPRGDSTAAAAFTALWRVPWPSSAEGERRPARPPLSICGLFGLPAAAGAPQASQAADD